MSDIELEPYEKLKKLKAYIVELDALETDCLATWSTSKAQFDSIQKAKKELDTKADALYIILDHARSELSSIRIKIDDTMLEIANIKELLDVK